MGTGGQIKPKQLIYKLISATYTIAPTHSHIGLVQIADSNVIKKWIIIILKGYSTDKII